GKTGVGKSTLINAIFGEPVAATGIGEPVTLDAHLYLDKRGTLGLIDTRGLEIGRDDAELIREVTKYVKAMRGKPLDEQMHVAWYCVRGMDRRFEEVEATFVRTLHELGIPVLMVFTQVPMREGQYHPDAVELARKIEAKQLPIVGGRPFMTYAMRDHFTGQPPYGLMDVLHATFQVVPEAVRGALAAAQTIDLEAKAKAASVHINTTVAAAAAAAAVPIPFSSAALLVPLQLGMMGRIAHLYQLPFDRAALLAVASSSVATSLGRSAAANLLKFIPGAGSIAGGVVNASVASSFTLAMGQAWLTVCQRAAAGKLPMMDGVVDSSAVRDLFDTEFRKRMPTIRQRDEQ
ncbi:MAG: GTPase family protein, partial [Actinomycetes bacterium]